jgi:hypothetical protein
MADKRPIAPAVRAGFSRGLPLKGPGKEDGKIDLLVRRGGRDEDPPLFIRAGLRPLGVRASRAAFLRPPRKSAAASGGFTVAERPTR